MIAQHAYFASAVCLFFVVVLTTAGVVLHRARHVATTGDVARLLNRLTDVDRYKLAQVAADLASPEPHTELESWQVWDLIGGMDGLEALAANCEVLIDLAAYVQQWYPEALTVAEQLRLNAREVQWHLGRLRGAERRGNLQTAFPEYAQRAVATYYEMTLRLRALFEVSQVPGYRLLQSAI